MAAGSHNKPTLKGTEYSVLLITVLSTPQIPLRLSHSSSPVSYCFSSCRLNLTVSSGSGIRVYGSKIDPGSGATNFSQWSCYIDGATQPFQNGTGSGSGNNIVLCEDTTLDDGLHIVTVNVTKAVPGQPFLLDALHYIPSPLLSLEDKVLRIDENDPKILYGFGWESQGPSLIYTEQKGSTLYWEWIGTSFTLVP